MGLVVLPLPWVFDRAWPVILLAVLACCTMVATRSIRSLRGGIGTVLSGVGRDSLGEIYFPIAVTSLFILGRADWLLYVVPILMLTLADAVAALVGSALRTAALQDFGWRQEPRGITRLLPGGLLQRSSSPPATDRHRTCRGRSHRDNPRAPCHDARVHVLARPGQPVHPPSVRTPFCGSIWERTPSFSFFTCWSRCS